MTKTELDNAIYKIIIDDLEPRENSGASKGNSHHIAQNMTTAILKKIFGPKEKGTVVQNPEGKERKYLACYKESNDLWSIRK